MSEKLKISSSSRSQSLPVPPQQVSRVAAVATSGQNKLRSYCDKSNKLVVMKMMVVVKVKVKKFFFKTLAAMIDHRSKWWLCLRRECLTDIVFYKKTDCEVTREHQGHHLYDMDGCVSANEMIMMVKIMKKINNNKWSVNQWGLEHNRRCRRQQLCQSFFNNVECWILLQHGIAGPKNIQNNPSSTPGAGL